MSRIDRLICHVLPNAFLMALVADGRLAELQIVRRDKPTRVESVFLGRLERMMPELDAAFVDIGIGRSGFLRAEDRAGIDDWPPPGAPLLVQVRNDGEGDKGPRLSMNLAVTGRYLVYHPVGAGVSFSRRIEGESERERLRRHVEGLLEGGIVLRTAAAGAGAEVLRADASQIMERWEQLRRHAFDAQPPADLTARMPGERGVDLAFDVVDVEGGHRPVVPAHADLLAQAIHLVLQGARHAALVEDHFLQRGAVIAQRTSDRIALARNARRQVGRRLGGERLGTDRLPALHDLHGIGAQNLEAGTGGCRAQHDAPFQQVLDMAAQAITLAFAFDAARKLTPEPTG